MFVLSYFKFFGGIKEGEFSGKTDMNTSPISYWNSYLRETYDDNDTMIDFNDSNVNYYLEISSDSMKICTYEPFDCDDINYKKSGNNYIIDTNNEKILNANLSIKDDTSDEYGNIIKIIKTYYDDEGGYSVFYFRRVNKEGIK